MLNSLMSLAMRSRGLRVVLNALRVRETAAAALRRWPLIRPVPGSTLQYRATTLDNLLVAREIFAEEEYGALRRFEGIRSFADLGCNCGYFTLFLTALAGERQAREIHGLAIDAHPDMVQATRWHVEHNGLTNVHPVWGVLGVTGAESAPFFVNVDAAGSSRFARAPETNVTEQPWTEIAVPAVMLAAEWQRRFGDAPCDVLKVDIEGSEDALLRLEAGFLARVSVLAIEMHRWIVDVPALEAFLHERGFEAAEVLRSNDDVHVALYVNRASRFHRHPAARAS